MIWKYFKISELQCRCGCGQCNMDDGFMKLLDEAREITNIPFNITSGFRCDEHDKKLNGGGNHPMGKAVDIRAVDGKEAFIIVSGLIKAGFKRIGISRKDQFIHVDSVIGKPTPCIWVY